jgi:hypothetical protein
VRLTARSISSPRLPLPNPTVRPSVLYTYAMLGSGAVRCVVYAPCLALSQQSVWIGYDTGTAEVA